MLQSYKPLIMIPLNFMSEEFMMCIYTSKGLELVLKLFQAIKYFYKVRREKNTSNILSVDYLIWFKVLYEDFSYKS